MESGSDCCENGGDDDICQQLTKFMKDHHYSAAPVVNIIEVDPVKDVESSACNDDFDNDELNDLLEEQILLKKIKRLENYRKSLAGYRDPALDKVDHHIKPKIENDIKNEIIISQHPFHNDALNNDSIADDDKIFEGILSTDKDSKEFFENQNRFEILKKLSKASALNVLMQSELTTLESVLMERLKEVIKEQIEVRAEISRLKLLKNNDVQKIPRKTFWYTIFGRPYFKDEQRYTCQKNEDAKSMKLKNQILTINLFQSKPWRIKEKYHLEEGVRKILIEELTGKLKNENELRNQLENNSASDANMKKEIRSQLKEINKKIEVLNNKSLKELFSVCEPDREFDWLKIAAKVVPKHSPEECQRMWHLYVKPTVNKERFTSNEDSYLKKLIEKNGEQSWDIVVKQLQTSRTEFLCFYNYKKRLKKGRNNCGKWTKEEDKKLLNIIKELRIGDFIPWPKVAFYFQDRSLPQLYSRWKNSINPDLRKGRFNKIEDRLLISYVRKYGENFTKISKILGYRNSTQVRQRYSLYKRIDYNVGRWSLEEDEMLLALVEKYGVSRWSQISKQFITRTRTQIRQRYKAIMNFMKRYPDHGINDIHRGPSAKSQTLIPVGAAEVKAACNERENKMLSELVQEDKKNIHSVSVTKFKKGRKKFLKRSPVDLKLIDYFKEIFSTDKLKLRTYYVKPDLDKAAGALMLFCCYFKTSLILAGTEFDEAVKKLPYTLKNVVFKMIEDEKGCDSFKAKFIGGTTNSGVPINRDTYFIDCLPVDPRETLVSDCHYLLSVIKEETEIDEKTISGEWSKPSNIIPYFLPPSTITMIGCRSLMLMKGKIIASLVHKCTKPSYYFLNDALLMKKNNLKFFCGYFSEDETVCESDDKINITNLGAGFFGNENETIKRLVERKVPAVPSSLVNVPASTPTSMACTLSRPSVNYKLLSSSNPLCTINETTLSLPSTSEECGPSSPPALFSDTPFVYEVDDDEQANERNEKSENKLMNVSTKRLTKSEAIALWKERLMAIFGWPLALANHVPDFSTNENEGNASNTKKYKKPQFKNINTSKRVSTTKDSTKSLDQENCNLLPSGRLTRRNEQQSKRPSSSASVLIGDNNGSTTGNEISLNIAANGLPILSNSEEDKQKETINQLGKMKRDFKKKAVLSGAISDQGNLSQDFRKITVGSSETHVPPCDESFRPKRHRKCKRWDEFQVY